MCFRNTKMDYGLVAKGFHWLVALLILFMLPLGYYMGTLERGEFRGEMYGLHKSIGITILALAVLRLIWRMFNPRPERQPSHKPWERLLSTLVQAGLYVLIIAFPLSGWIMSAAGGHPVSFFGLFDMPPFVEKGSAAGKIAHEAHEIFPYIIGALIGLHVLGAAKHHFIDKDRTFVTMWAEKSKNFGMVLVLALALLSFSSAGYFLALKEAREKKHEKEHSFNMIIIDDQTFTIQTTG